MAREKRTAPPETTAEDDLPPALLPTLSANSLYRMPEIGVYHALEKSGPRHAREHPEAQIMTLIYLTHLTL